MYTIMAKVYGRTGHRQKMSFNRSIFSKWAYPDDITRINILNADITGTNEYSVVIITCENKDKAHSTLNGQISDGAFENYNTGYIEIFNEGDDIIAIWE